MDSKKRTLPFCCGRIFVILTHPHTSRPCDGVGWPAAAFPTRHRTLQEYSRSRGVS